jgi:uncharacterized membrane protein
MTWVLDLLGAALIGGMFLLTALYYPYLPERVPTHFGFNGRPDQWGPRWTIWLLPVVGVVIWAVMAGASAAAGQARIPLALLRAEVLALFFLITRDQLRVAVGAQQRVSWGVWVMLLVILVSAFFMPRG